jgi:hypothetical protein
MDASTYNTPSKYVIFRAAEKITRYPQLATFVENSYRRVPFMVCQPRKTNFRFPVPFAANKWKFAVVSFSPCNKQTEDAIFRYFCFPYTHIYIYIYVYIYIYIVIYIYIYVSNKKRKMEAHASFLNLFNSLLIVQMKVCCLSVFLTKKRTKVIRLQMD